MRARSRARASYLLLLLSVVGPGVIAANADNDASGIYGYSLAGVQYQYRLLWILVLVTVSLGVCQEICARMGAVTGKGFADLIREKYGVRITLFAMATLLVANYATMVSEFAGISAATEMFAPDRVRWIVVPVMAVLLWILITRGTYTRVERVLLVASVVYLAYIASAIMAHPHWPVVIRQMVWPAGVRWTQDYTFMVINVVGTTITPWGQFYIQSTVRDKGIRVGKYWITRADVLFGAFFTNFIAFFIIVCCGATLYHAGQAPNYADAGAIAAALRPVAGSAAAILFAFGLFNASCFGAVTVSLSTAYALTEAFGTESGLGRRAREAPIFIGVLTVLLFTSAATVLFAGRYLTVLIILPNLVGGMLLPIILVLMLRLVNDPAVMGSYTNSRVYNAIAWTTTVVLIILSVVLVAQPVYGWIRSL